MDSEVIVYTKGGCGNCKILKSELDKAGIAYRESENYPVGLMSLPAMLVGDKLMLYREAISAIPSLTADAS